METLSHRDLRNRSAEVLRAVAAGESFTITNGGRPVAQLLPLSADVPDLPLARSPRTEGGFGQLTRHQIRGSAQSVIDELRGER